MTGRSFITAQLGDDTLIAFEAAFGADLLGDPAGDTWDWTDVSADAQHNPGVPITVGRADNVAQVAASSMPFKLLNSAGLYTAGGPDDIGVTQNTPLRERISLDGGSTWVTRYQGYLDTANPTTNQTGKVRYVDVKGIGALGRLGGQKKPLQSALYRQLLADGPVAYWPMEDGSAATSASSAVSSVAAMPISTTAGPSKFAADGPPGSKPLPDFSGGAQGNVSFGGATDGSFAVSFALRMLDTSAYGTVPLLFYTTTGRWEIEYDNLFGGFTLVANYNGNSTHGAGINTATTDGEWHFITVSAKQSGSDISIAMCTDGVALTGTITGESVGTIVSVQVAPHVGTTQTGNTVNKWPFEIGHIQIVSPTVTAIPPTLDADASAAIGWAGETVDDRMTRLCAEENIPLDLRGTSATAMGAQGVDTILNLLREGEAADHGVLYDGFSAGIGYQCRSDRYNLDPVLTLDMGTPLEVDTFAPIFDKQAIKNQYTVSRKDGGSAIYEQTTGPLGTATIGVEDATATVNIDDDDDLPDHASWLVSLGTVAGFRFPGTGLNLRKIPTRAADVLAVEIGSRITIQNPASKSTDLPPDDIDLIVEGWTETTTATGWLLALNCSPFQPFRVFVIEDDELGRLDTGGSAVMSPVTSTATTLPVVTGIGPAWTEDSDDMPFDINVGGERCTVTDIAASTTPGTRVGARLDTAGYGGGHWNADSAVWESITGITLPVTRWYQAAADFTIGTDLTQIIGAGVKVCLSLRPDATPNPTHRASIDTMLAGMTTSGAEANITIWHEPFFGGLTAAQFQTVIRYYGPTVRKYFPLWIVLSGDDTDPANGYYPPAASYDGVAVDNYVASPVGNITDAQAVADADGKPFGIWEFNGAADLGSPAPPVGQTEATVTTRFQLIQDLFADRLTAGKPNGDLILFSAQGGTTGTRNFLGHAFTANGGFEGGIGNWVNGSGTIAQTAAQAHSGTKSAQITSPAGGGTSNILMCQTPSITTQGLPCTAGQKVMGYGWFRSAVTARLCRIDIHWYNAAGTALSVATGTTVTDSTTGWTSAQISGTAPANTAFARLEPAIQSTAASEVHYFDDPQIAVLPTNPLTSAIQYPWDYRIALLADMVTALDETSFGQDMTVTRAVNGVAKSHPIGTEVALWRPAVLAL